MSKSKLAKNTAMLYILTFSSYAFMLITIPYQTRVLGPEAFGLLGVATAVMTFVGLLLDFGFILYATGEITKTKNNKDGINTLYSSVTYIKLILAVFSAILLVIASMYISFVADNMTLFSLYLLAYIAQALLPDFLYRGMEDMTPITLRSILARSIFLLLIFTFLKSSDQYLLVPMFLLISNTLALIFAWIDVYKRFNIKLSRVKTVSIINAFKASSQFFFSRIATTIYGASSTLIVNMITPGASVGYFASADKLVTTAKTGMSPIADSIYPYMINKKEYSLLKNILLVTSFFSILCCIIVFLNAEAVISLLFGADFIKAAPILKALLPILVITPAQYLLGFPALSPIGLQKHANYSIFVSVACYVLILVALIMLHITITPVTIALTMSASEIASFIYRLSIVTLAKYKWRLI